MFATEKTGKKRDGRNHHPNVDHLKVIRGNGGLFQSVPARVVPARVRGECLAGKSLFMRAISARCPATLGMWPAKEWTCNV
jgi:hypothetical protein